MVTSITNFVGTYAKLVLIFFLFIPITASDVRLNHPSRASRLVQHLFHDYEKVALFFILVIFFF